MASTIQFKRGSSAKWKELNLVLAAGEPGYDTTTGRIKVGDGVTAWNDLLYQDELAVVSKATRFEFPSYGKTNTLYKDETAHQLYQWVADDSGQSGHYEVVGTENVIDITIINGGDANGTT